ncbi:MAG: M14 family metallopeptidase [Flavobacterium sp.]
MKKLAIIITFFISFAGLAQFNPQNKKITEKFFPDAELDINTPAFKKDKGFTTYDELMAYLNELAAAHPDVVTLSFVGESQKGKKIPMVVLNKRNNAEKVKVWFQGGLHGDEPASTETMLYILNKMLNDKQYTYLLDKITLGMIPMANIDGYEKQDRYAANGLDLNRDQVKLQAQESVYLKKAFSDFGAEVAVDFHEYRPFRKDFTNFGSHGIAQLYDAMFMYSGNLNLSQELRDLTKNVFVANAKAALDKNKLRHHDYMTTIDVGGDIHFSQGTVDARSSTTSYALSNAVSSLIEIRGVELGRTSFKRRIHTTFLIAEAYITTAYNEGEQLKKVLAAAKTPAPEIVVESKKKVEKEKILVIDLATNDEMPLEVTIHNALKATPTLTRQRPVAYLLLPAAKELADKLQTLGLKVETLASAKKVQVEAYTVTSYKRVAEKTEGFNEQDVKATVLTKEVDFPAGTYIVYLDQKNAKIATEILEPENDNGFVKFEVLKTEKNQELPVYRYLNHDKL